VFSGARVHVVRNPLPRTRAGAFSPPGARLRTIGYLGALEAIKGVDQLLAAAPELMRLGYKLRLAGEGRMRPAVEHAAAHSPGVAYDGVVAGPAKEAFLQRCDLGIMPSVWAEPGGPSFAMVEWLSAGRPAVVSNRGGLGEAINLFPGAIAVEPTAQGIVAAVAPFLDETAWRRAVERVRRPDSAEDGLNRWVCEHERILRSALGERRRRR
jgi:glycosyltransferase involved in cell wall biosynthesis